MYQYEQARELSISLLEEWLVNYKFKNWKKTEQRKRTVTPAMKKRRASKIAKKLSETKTWHSHNRGIPMDVLKRDVELKIEDYEKDTELNKKIRAYFRVLADYRIRRGHHIILHTRNGYKVIL